jgi:HEAT repeat protein
MIWCLLCVLLVARARELECPQETSCCGLVAQQIESPRREEFEKGLNGMVECHCKAVLPRVADLLIASAAPSPYKAVNALAAIGRPDYGPLLIKLYINAPLGLSPSVEYPNSIWEDVLRGCDDQAVEGYAEANTTNSVNLPRLSDKCLKELRRLLEGHYESQPVAATALILLQESATPDAVDIAKRFFAVDDVATRDGAILALQHLPLSATFKTLSRGLSDESVVVRLQAVRILSQWHDKEVVALLEARLETESNELVREQIVAYLTSVDPKPLPK